MTSFKTAYLIHGDDHGRIAERRARLRAMAEKASGAAGVELFEEDACTPSNIAQALTAMTFALGRRFVIADGVQRWKQGEVAPVAAAMSSMDPSALTVAFFAREDSRSAAPAALHDAVRALGGQIAREGKVKPRDLPRWVASHAAECGIEIDSQAARALVSQVGERQQRLLREIEKLALEHGAGARLGVENVLGSSASSAERKLWTLADALVSGDSRGSTQALVELRQQGERLPGLIYGIVRRLRDATAVADALAAGQSVAQVKRGLRMPSFAADRLVAEVSKRDVLAFRRATALMADLELESRGGGSAALSEETAAVRAVIAAAR